VKGTWDALFGFWQPADAPNALKLNQSSDKLCLARGKKIPLDRFKEIQRCMKGFFEVTLNDIFISMLTLTLYRYLERKKDPLVHLKKPKLHIDIPVDLKARRVGVDPCDISNNVHYVTIRLPLEMVAAGRKQLLCKIR